MNSSGGDSGGDSGGLGADEWTYYSDGAWYDAEYVHIGGDVPYWERVARESPGPILELACGTGRLSIPMSVRAGRPVVGVDIAPSMIERALVKRSRLPPDLQANLQFLVGDMRSVRLGSKFPCVVLAFNTLMHMLEDDDLAATLATAREHLLPDGFFHLELHTPHPSIISARDPAGRYDPQQMIDPHTGYRWVVTENNRYDPRTQINHMHFYYRRADAQGRAFGEERQVTLRLRVIFPRELDRWLRDSGFEVVGDWDDFARSKPFSGEGGRRVMALKLK